MRPPTSLMAAIPTDEIDAVAKASPLWPEYAEEIDPDRRREAHRQARGVGHRRAPARPPKGGGEEGGRRARRPARKKGKAKPTATADDGNAVTDFLKSREGRATVNNVVRGAMGVLKGFMK